LLDSYDAERLPVIKDVIATTDLMTRTMGTPNMLAEALRDIMIPMISRWAPFQRAFVQRLSELGIAYHRSPIIEGAGKRYIDDSLRGGDGILRRFVLMLDGRADPAVIDAARQLQISMDDVLELRAAPRQGVMLVRPDGYIGFAAEHADRGALAEVRKLLERQTMAAAPESVHG
jgi:hypothetical protein